MHIIIAPNPLPPGDDIQSGDSDEYYDTQSDFDQLMSQLLSSPATRDWNGLKYLQQTSAVMWCGVARDHITDNQPIFDTMNLNTVNREWE